jgi:deoxyribonuclease-4
VLFGAHVSSSGGISNALDRAEALGCDAVQVFTQSPRMWRPTAHAPEQIERFRERRAETGIGAVVCHAVYLVNLASPEAEIHAKSVDALRATLGTAAAIGADAVIFHVGSHLGSGFEAGVEPARAARSAAHSTSSRCSSRRSTGIPGSVSAWTRATGSRRASTSPTARCSTLPCAS